MKINNLRNRICRSPDDGGGNGGGDGQGQDEENKNGAPPAGAGDGTGGGKDSLIDLADKPAAKEGEKPTWLPADKWDAEKKALKEGIDPLKEWEQAQVRAEGLRKELGKGSQLAPKDVKDYKLPQFSDEKDAKAAELLKGDKEFIDKITATAHKHGLSQKQYEGFIGDVARELAQVDLGETKELTDAEREEIATVELAKIGPSGPRVAAAVSEFLVSLVKQGHFNDGEIRELKAMAATGEGLSVLNKMRVLQGGESIPLGDSLTVDGLLSDAEIFGLIGTKEYNTPEDPGHAAMQQKVEKQLNLRQKAGRPDRLQV